MKRVVVASRQQSLLSNLELILKHWGYRSLGTPHHDDVCGLLETTEPDLVIFDAPWLRENIKHLVPLMPRLENTRGIRLAVMDDGKETLPVLPSSVPVRKIPADIFSLYGLTQTVLQNHPRLRLRTGVHLPGMFRRDGRQWDLAQIMTLGTGGMFIRSGHLLKNSEALRLCVPLFGMKEELEVRGKIVYEVQPTPENNYQQGYGIEFTELEPQSRLALNHFVAGCFMRELEAPTHQRETSVPGVFNSMQEEYSLASIAI